MSNFSRLTRWGTITPQSLNSEFDNLVNALINYEGGINLWPTLGISGFTPGSVIYITSGGLFAQDNAHLFWDASNQRLGIGTATPSYPVQIGAGTPLASQQTGVALAINVSAAANGHGFADYSTFSVGPGSTAYASFDTRAATSGSSNFDHLIGYQSDPQHLASGTLSKLNSFYAVRTVNGGTVNFSAGLYVEDITDVSGAITNQYGIYVEDQTHGGTIKRAIFTAGTAPSQFSGGIRGVAGTGAASAGNIGEYVESVVSGVSAATSGNFADLTSISLTAGDWDVSLNVSANANGATITDYRFGISQTTGDSATGLVEGSNYMLLSAPASFGYESCSIANYRQSLSATTTIYAKTFGAYSVATPVFAGRLSARRSANAA